MAAGVDTPRVLALCGFKLQLRHAPGILAHSAPLPELTRIIHDGPGNLSFKQMANGSVVGTDAPEPPDLPVHAAIRAGPVDFPDDALRALHGNRILGKIAGLLPRCAMRAWSGCRSALDPCRWTSCRWSECCLHAGRVRHCHAQRRHARADSGRWMSSELMDASRIEALAPYRPERFG